MLEMKLWQLITLILGCFVLVMFLFARWMDRNVQDEPKCDCGSGKYQSLCDCWKQSGK